MDEYSLSPLSPMILDVNYRLDLLGDYVVLKNGIQYIGESESIEENATYFRPNDGSMNNDVSNIEQSTHWRKESRMITARRNYEDVSISNAQDVSEEIAVAIVGQPDQERMIVDAPKKRIPLYKKDLRGCDDPTMRIRIMRAKRSKEFRSKNNLRIINLTKENQKLKKELSHLREKILNMEKQFAVLSSPNTFKTECLCLSPSASDNTPTFDI